MRRLAVLVPLLLGVATALMLGSSSNAADVVSTAAVPAASCGPGSTPESGLQGRVPKADFSSGRAALGYTCNTVQVSHHGATGGFKTLRYADPAGHVCGYYDSSQLTSPDKLVGNAFNGAGDGVVVLDMADPAHPVKTANLTSIAMLAPHESLLVNNTRGLLIGVLGTAATAPGVLDVYDVRTDCRHPKLLSTSLSGILGHESGFAPDGRTLYVSSTIASLVAVDLTNPSKPKTIFTSYGQYHGMRVSDDGRTLYAAHIGQPSPGGITGGGLVIMDVSQVQDRVPHPRVPILATMSWVGHSIPQVAEPFARNGHHYLFEVDEFVDIFSFNGLTDLKHSPVGAARIINIDDPRQPYVVSNVRLQVHEPANHAGAQYSDPGANNPLQGYAGHYCSMPTRIDPNLAACSMILSGLRVFNITDVLHPTEVAYFNKPASGGGSAFAQPAWDVAHDSIWFTDTSTGFFDVRLTNGVQDLLPAG